MRVGGALPFSENFWVRTSKWDILRHRHPAPDPIGIYPETKHPSYFDSIGLSMEEPLVALLHKHGYNGKHAPVYIQSFEVGNLKDLRRMTQLPLVQLLNDSGKPYDFVLKGDPRTYADLAKPEGLAEIAAYADGVGVNKNLISPRDESNRIGTPTTLVQDAHAKGLIVHGWTFVPRTPSCLRTIRAAAIPLRSVISAVRSRYFSMQA